MPIQYLTELPWFAGLPEDLRELVADIEHHAGLRVVVEPTAKEKMSCEFGKRRAVVQVPEAGPPRASSLFHELLHLKRYFVDGTPKLVYCDEHEFEDDDDARTPQLFVSLDNQIEHLFIVPLELARYNCARGYWEERMGAVLKEPQLSDDGAVVVWEFIHRVLKGGGLSDAAQVQVDQRGLGEACDRFHHAVDESKEAATLCLFEIFAPAKLPRACLDYFGQQQEIPLASLKRPAI